MPLRSRAVLPLLLLGIACSENQPLAPEAPLFSMGRNGFQVVNLHVGADVVAGSTSRIRGPLQIRFGTRYPPNPCIPNPGPPDAPALVVCGVLHNPGGETLTGGELRIGDTRTGQVVRFGLSAPPNPCNRLFIAGTLAVPGMATNPGPPDISATFTTLDGQQLRTWRAHGPRGIRTPSPGPPEIFTPNPGPPESCTATILPTVGY